MTRNPHDAQETALDRLPDASVITALRELPQDLIRAARSRAARRPAWPGQEAELSRRRRKLMNSAPSRSRRRIMSGLRSISADISAILPARK
jgi:hypothetical protein